MYRNPHYKCPKQDCQTHTAYIRTRKKWIKVGEYHSVCKGFTSSKDTREYVRRKSTKEKMPGEELDLSVAFAQLLKV